MKQKSDRFLQISPSLSGADREMASSVGATQPVVGCRATDNWQEISRTFWQNGRVYCHSNTRSKASG
ncbi:MAG: hypothetical protein AAF268_15460 [Cyanobacteria bacterium P01_A01_bin.3]